MQYIILYIENCYFIGVVIVTSMRMKFENIKNSGEIDYV